MTRGLTICSLLALIVAGSSLSPVRAEGVSQTFASPVWEMPPAYFDPYTTAPETLLPTWSPGTGEKSLGELLFTPYFDVNGKCRSFPLAASLALDRGYELPLPFGASATYTYLNVSPVVRDVQVGLAGGPMTSIPVSVDNLKNDTQNLLLRIDGWLLPFLNVYGLIGETSLTSSGNLTIPNPLPLRPDIMVPIRVDTSGPMYGVGAVLAVGYKQWFLAFDTNFTRNDLSLFDSKIEKSTFGARTGLRMNVAEMKASVWLGTMYVDRRTFLEGTVLSGTALDPIKYSVESEFENPWNFLVGTSWEVTPSFQLTFEFGFGDREQATAAVSYRF